MRKKEFYLGLSIGLVIGVIAIVSMVLGVSEQLRDFIFSAYKGNATTGEIMREVEILYKAHYNKEIGEIDESEIVNAYIKEVGDKWGVYLTEKEVADYLKSQTESYCGIGVYTSKESGVYKITRVGDNTPASKAGLQVGDTITKINEIEIDKLEKMHGKDNAMEELSGKENTPVSIEVNGNEEKLLARENMSMDSVEVKTIEDGIQLIKIYSFSDKTVDEFKDKVDYKAGKYILDLRGNSGGDFNAVIKIADIILKEGLIVTELNKNGDLVEYKSDKEHIDGSWVVLVDSETASASELITQAMRDYGETKVVGSKTVGKGTIFDRVTLSNGGYLFISSGEYKTKSGYSIEGAGVELDKEINGDTETVTSAAVEMLKGR